MIAFAFRTFVAPCFFATSKICARFSPFRVSMLIVPLLQLSARANTDSTLVRVQAFERASEILRHHPP